MPVQPPPMFNGGGNSGITLQQGTTFAMYRFGRNHYIAWAKVTQAAATAVTTLKLPVSFPFRLQRACFLADDATAKDFHFFAHPRIGLDFNQTPITAVAGNPEPEYLKKALADVNLSVIEEYSEIWVYPDGTELWVQTAGTENKELLIILYLQQLPTGEN